MKSLLCSSYRHSCECQYIDSRRRPSFGSCVNDKISSLKREISSHTGFTEDLWYKQKQRWHFNQEKSLIRVFGILSDFIMYRSDFDSVTLSVGLIEEDGPAEKADDLSRGSRGIRTMFPLAARRTIVKVNERSR
jgi:hypothetical protein